jgi:hypothetical protein
MIDYFGWHQSARDDVCGVLMRTDVIPLVFICQFLDIGDPVRYERLQTGRGFPQPMEDDCGISPVEAILLLGIEGRTNSLADRRGHVGS